MIGQRHLGDLKTSRPQFGRAKDVVELSSRGPAWMGGLPLAVYAFQTRCGKKLPQFPITPQHVEIPGNDHRLFCIIDQGLKIFKLVAAVPEPERQVYQENGACLQLQLDDQPLHPLAEIMEPLRLDLLICQNCVPLLVQDRDLLYQGIDGILGLIDIGALHLSGDGGGLIVIVGTERPAVHLDQSDNVRADSPYEIDDSIQIAIGALQITAIGYRQVEMTPNPSPIPYIIQQKSHTAVPSLCKKSTPKGRGFSGVKYLIF
jgi:hypothetical protein